MPKWPWRRNNTALAKKALSSLPSDVEKALSEDIKALTLREALSGNVTTIGSLDMANPEFHLNKTMEIIDTLDREEIALREQLINEEIRYKAELEDGQKHHAIEMERIGKQLSNTQRTKAGYLACANALKPPAEPHVQQVGRGNRRVLPDGVVVTDLAAGFVDPEVGQRIAETRKTFEIPPGHEAVEDAEGRATGEVRPIKVVAPRRRRKPATRINDTITASDGKVTQA